MKLEIIVKLNSHALWLETEGECGECANLRGADLSEANLRWANLSEADLRGANLRWANLRWANLSEADLSEADLRWANLRGADLSEANLRWANLSEADLRGADLDFSAWPLWCGSFSVKVNDRILAQLMMHVARLDVSGCNPVARYAFRVVFQGWAGRYLTNLFTKYRSDVDKI